MSKKEKERKALSKNGRPGHESKSRTDTSSASKAGNKVPATKPARGKDEDGKNGMGKQSSHGHSASYSSKQPLTPDEEENEERTERMD